MACKPCSGVGSPVSLLCFSNVGALLALRGVARCGSVLAFLRTVHCGSRFFLFQSCTSPCWEAPKRCGGTARLSDYGQILALVSSGICGMAGLGSLRIVVGAARNGTTWCNVSSLPWCAMWKFVSCETKCALVIFVVSAGDVPPRAYMALQGLARCSSPLAFFGMARYGASFFCLE